MVMMIMMMVMPLLLLLKLIEITIRTMTTFITRDVGDNGHDALHNHEASPPLPPLLTRGGVLGDHEPNIIVPAVQ